jgi:hypothetical protein
LTIGLKMKSHEQKLILPHRRMKLTKEGKIPLTKREQSLKVHKTTWERPTVSIATEEFTADYCRYKEQIINGYVDVSETNNYPPNRNCYDFSQLAAFDIDITRYTISRDTCKQFAKAIKKRLWRACNLIAFIHSSTGPCVVHPFASHHEGPEFNPQGGTYVKPGFSC